MATVHLRVSVKERDGLIDYVKRQEEHHKTVSFKEELIILLKKHEVEFDVKHLH